jgi:hypothetical protein
MLSYASYEVLAITCQFPPKKQLSPYTPSSLLELSH